MVISHCPDVSILHRLRAHAESRTDHLAYRFLHDDVGSDALTFGQLDQRVHGLAARLRELASAGERALLLYPPGLEFIEAFLGCLAAGIIAVPAYPPRRNRKAERLFAIAENARPQLILTSKESLSSVEESELRTVRNCKILATDEIEVETDIEEHLSDLDNETVAFLQYTSGSTQTPRGVIVTHENLMANERAIQKAFGHSHDDIVVGWLPLFHDMGLIGNVLQPLFVGFPAILFSPASFLREPVRWLQLITEYRGTTAGAPNFGYDHCVRSITEDQKKGLDLSSWKIAYNGSEPVRTSTLDSFADAFGGCGFRREAFFPCYGLAEATLFVSGGPPGQRTSIVRVSAKSLEKHQIAEITEGDVGTRTLVSSGQIADSTRVVVVDLETRTECLPEKVGEIWVASASVATGYWKRDDETQKVFRARLDTCGEDFLRTGDAGFIRNGELFITGRIKDLIIIHGRNIYPQDIEAVVERNVSFAKANSVAAFAVETAGGERLAVAIESDRSLVHMMNAGLKARLATINDGENHNRKGALESLVAQVCEAIAREFEITPHIVAFVRPGSFPKTSSGKVQRHACRAGLLAGTLEIVYAWQATGSSNAALPLDEEIVSPVKPERQSLTKAMQCVAMNQSQKSDNSTNNKIESVKCMKRYEMTSVGKNRNDYLVATHQAERYKVENEHLQREQKTHALLIAITPIISIAILIAVLWGTKVTWFDLGLLIIMYSLAIIGITVGFHRHFTHKAFKTLESVRVVLAVLGSMAAQAPLIYWVATHRRHHQFSDVEGDPHSPHFTRENVAGMFRGFWHAHVGWMYRHETTNTAIYAKDLLRDPTVRLMNRLYTPFILLGLAIPASIAAIVTESWIGICRGLFWGGFLRIFLGHHFTWSVNSICHLYGRRDSDTDDHSVNNAWLAIPTFGESWHNNHHAIPSAATFSFKWWQLDLGALVVNLLERVGLAWDVKRPQHGGQLEMNHSTDDLGLLEGNEAIATGQSEDLIIIRGQHIHPQDIETVIARLLPFVEADSCAAFSLEKNGEERLGIVIEANRGLGSNGEVCDTTAQLEVAVSKIRQGIGEEFGLQVDAIVFVRPGSMPRTPSGKIHRLACRNGLLKLNLP